MDVPSMLFALSYAATYGLLSAPACSVACIPVMLPQLVIHHGRTVRGLLFALSFNLGRLAAYAALAFSAWLVGERAVGDSGVAVASSLVLGCLLVLQGATGVNGRGFCLPKLLNAATYRGALVLGLVASLRPCLSVAVVLTYMLVLHGLIQRVLFLLVFWLASSTLLIGVGGATGASIRVVERYVERQRLRNIASVALIVIGLFYIIQGLGIMGAR